MNLSLRAKLASIAVVAAAGAALMTGFNWYSSRVSTQALESVYESNVRSLVQLQKIDALLLDIRFRVAGVLLEVMPVQGSLNHLRDARKELESTWATAGHAAVSDTAAARAQIEQMTAGWNNVKATLDRLDRAYVGKNDGELKTVLEEDWSTVHTSFVKPLAGLIVMKEQEARATYDAANATSRSLGYTTLALALVVTALIVAAAAFVMRSVGRSLDDAVAVARRVADGDLQTDVVVRSNDELGRMLGALKTMRSSLCKVMTDVAKAAAMIDTASGEIAAGNQDLSQRTEEQASSLEETASSMEELTSTVKQNADNARQANQLAARATEVAVQGGAVVGEVVTTMGAINDSSKKIADIIGVIDGIAFQTNILALNAAVEAARAGEQGRGFAVVASEVRSLAQRSATAAKEIKALIEDSVGKVDSGAKLVDQARRTMEEVVSSIKRVTDIMGEITAASQEQSGGIEQVSQAVAQMDHVTQQNAALVEQAAAAAESMKDQARQLASAIAVFKLDSAAMAQPTEPLAREYAPPVPPHKKARAAAKTNAPLAQPAAKPMARTGTDNEWTEF